MPRGYVVMTEIIHDDAGMAAHGAVTYDSLVEHGARMLVVDNDYEGREGTWEAGSRLAIIEFETPEVAREWYESEAGQKAHILRREAADCNVVIASGFVPKNAGNKLAVDTAPRPEMPEPPRGQSGIPFNEADLPEEALGLAPAGIGWRTVGWWWWERVRRIFISRISRSATVELWRSSWLGRGPMAWWRLGPRG